MRRDADAGTPAPVARDGQQRRPRRVVGRRGVLALRHDRPPRRRRTHAHAHLPARLPARRAVRLRAQPGDVRRVRVLDAGCSRPSCAACSTCASASIPASLLLVGPVLVTAVAGLHPAPPRAEPAQHDVRAVRARAVRAALRLHRGPDPAVGRRGDVRSAELGRRRCCSACTSRSSGAGSRACAACSPTSRCGACS